MLLHPEVYYRNHRWWFAVTEKGRLGETVDYLLRRVCRTKKDAYAQAKQAVECLQGKASHAQ